LNAKEIFKKNSKLMERHEFIIQLRNQYVAHAGLTTHESVKTIILLDEDPSKRVTPKITTFSNHMYCFEQNGFELFLELVEHIDKNVIEMSRKVFERIVNKELKNVSDEELYELAKKKKPLTL
ncbi:MAG: hypothetical protein LC127_05585, partial [Chitinophagales bacterium]|nr:hypothetical protein [Chitinophagales bacterium]